MIIVNTSNEELLKSVKDDMDRLQKEAEGALEENKDEAEDIAEDHGEDTKTVKEVITDKTDRKQLKSMHLSESLFEDLDDSVYFDVINICDAFKDGDISIDELIDELTYINERVSSEKVDSTIPGFEDTKNMLDKLTIYGESLNESTSTANIWLVQRAFNRAKDLGLEKEAMDILQDRGIKVEKEGTCVELPNSACTGAYIDLKNLINGLNESLTEDLSPKGKKLVAELKQELGPELQRKVVALMKDLQSSITTTANKAVSKVKEESGEKQTNESLNESMWSVYYVDDDPQEGTLFAEEEDARKFQLEMGDDWEVTQLPNTPWDDLADTDLL